MLLHHREVSHTNPTGLPPSAPLYHPAEPQCTCRGLLLFLTRPRPSRQVLAGHSSSFTGGGWPLCGLPVISPSGRFFWAVSQLPNVRLPTYGPPPDPLHHRKAWATSSSAPSATLLTPRPCVRLCQVHRRLPGVGGGSPAGLRTSPWAVALTSQAMSLRLCISGSK